MKCVICPFRCAVDRSRGETGVCGAAEKIKVAKIMAHHWEEPCISGTRGSGTIFFSGCNGSCIFCQNFRISQSDAGEYMEDETILAKCEELVRNSGIHNINLVTPTHYSLELIRLIPKLKERLGLPVVWNSNGYERENIVRRLKGLVDIFLPDLKYFDNNLAEKLSGFKNYFSHASKAILAMQSVSGSASFDEEGIMQRGMIIRHLILPGQVADSKNILRWIAEHLGTETWISLMSQYYPAHLANQIEELNRPITDEEYEEVQDYCLDLGFENGFFQDLNSNSAEYTPDFSK